jgi:hypothetical protein
MKFEIVQFLLHNIQKARATVYAGTTSPCPSLSVTVGLTPRQEILHERSTDWNAHRLGFSDKVIGPLDQLTCAQTLLYYPST